MVMGDCVVMQVEEVSDRDGEGRGASRVVECKESIRENKGEKWTGI